MTLQRTEQTINRVGLFGALINGSLFAMKFAVGLLTGSIAMTSDAFNNLSDFLNSMITFIALRFSLKPADEGHPYGHERFEIIAGFTVALVMLMLAFETIRSGFNALLSMDSAVTSSVFIYMNLISIIFKFALLMLNRKYAKETKSSLLRVNVIDSLFDILISISLILGFALQSHTTLNLDAILGMAIGVILVVTAIRLLLEFISGLLGKQASTEEIQGILAVLDANQDIEGYHDLHIHSYGKFHKYALVHVEVEQRMTLLHAHRIIDQIEEDVFHSTGIRLDVHLDPLDLSSPEIKIVVQKIKEVLNPMSESIDFHDVRIDGRVLSLDVVNPPSSGVTNELILHEIHTSVPHYTLEIEFETLDLIKTFKQQENTPEQEK